MVVVVVVVVVERMRSAVNTSGMVTLTRLIYFLSTLHLNAVVFLSYVCLAPKCTERQKCWSIPSRGE